MSKVKFPNGSEGVQPKTPKGIAQISDEVLSSLIDAARLGGIEDQFILVAHLTQLYGGDLIQNAIRVNEIEADDKKLDDMRRRPDNIDLVPPSEVPRTSPRAYGEAE